MKRPTLTNLSGTSGSDQGDRITTAMMDAIESNDKTIEIKPTDRSGGRGVSRLLLLVVGAVGIAYWLRASQRPNDLIENARRKTADRTAEATEQAAQTIEGGSETVAERVEEAGETAAERAEEAGESMSDEDDDDSFSGS